MHEYVETERKCGLVCNPYNSLDTAVLTNTGRDCKGAVLLHDGEVKPILRTSILQRTLETPPQNIIKGSISISLAALFQLQTLP